MTDTTAAPTVSIIIPAKDEAGYLPETLASIQELEPPSAENSSEKTTKDEFPSEVILVDGHSTDATPDIARDHGATVLEQPGDGGIGAARNYGASHSSGDWLLFVDADTRLHPSFLSALIPYCREHGYAAATARTTVTGGYRARLLEISYNQLFPRKRDPILPGFATLIRREAFEDVGGFPEVPSEDRAFSHELSTHYDVGFYPEPLVETSGRRVERAGILRTMGRYLWLDLNTFRHQETSVSLSPWLFVTGIIALIAAFVQVGHGLTVDYRGPGGSIGHLAAGAGLLGGTLLYALGAFQLLILVAGIVFVAIQLISLAMIGPVHPVIGPLLGAILVALGCLLSVLTYRHCRSRPRQ